MPVNVSVCMCVCVCVCACLCVCLCICEKICLLVVFVNKQLYFWGPWYVYDLLFPTGIPEVAAETEA